MPARIQTLARPNKLYRYRSLTDKPGDKPDSKAKKELKAIEDNYVWSSNYKSMSDPMEGLYRGDETFKDNPEIWQRIFENKAAIGIVSFSETVSNELMWAHYTDNMRGICIEYDVSRLLEALEGEEVLVRMAYDEEMPTVSNTSSPDRLARRILSRKNHRWSQEREWRLLTRRLHEVPYTDPNCITQIILGPQMASHHMEVFRALESRFDVRQIEVDGYRLTVRSFDEPLRFQLPSLQT